jgi:hypothetical protein
MFFELLQHYANAKVIHFFNIILTKDDFFSFQMLFFSKNAKTGRFSIHLRLIISHFSVVLSIRRRCHLADINIALGEWNLNIVTTQRIINKFARS